MKRGAVITVHHAERTEVGIRFTDKLAADETIVSGASLIVFDKSDADVTDAFLEAASVEEDGKTVAAWKVSGSAHTQPRGNYRVRAIGTTTKHRTLVSLMTDTRFPILVVVDGFRRP